MKRPRSNEILFVIAAEKRLLLTQARVRRAQEEEELRILLEKQELFKRYQRFLCAAISCEHKQANEIVSYISARYREINFRRLQRSKAEEVLKTLQMQVTKQKERAVSECYSEQSIMKLVESIQKRVQRSRRRVLYHFEMVDMGR